VKIVLAILLAWPLAHARGFPERRLNTFAMTFSDGRGELEWVSTSTFRFARTWGGALERRPAYTVKALPVAVEEGEAELRFETRYLTVEVDRGGRLVRIADGRGKPLTEWRLERGALEAPIGRAERLYGLEASGTAGLDLRGSRVGTRRPFLLSSAGYGEFYPPQGEYRFDLGAARAGRRRVALPGDTVEVIFHFGPSAQAIFEEHLEVSGAIEPFGADKFRVRERGGRADGTWESLRAKVVALEASGLSGRLAPEFDLSPWAGANARLALRAAQIAAVMPVVYAPPNARGFERLRNRLEPFLLSYAKDARDRGSPILRPLVFEWPDDPEAARNTDEFMAGDELLVAPGLDPGEEREVYLPRGFWTELATGERLKGGARIRVRLREDGPPMFVRSGSIVPLRPEAEGAPLELHYFPSLAAEFFLYEEDRDDISQVHAGPAGDVLRLEIESLAARTYEWVIHGPQEKRIRVVAKAGGDEIVNVPW
jgi:alpha-glucosidase (family GH31 glycosyl hydrolase)